MLAASSCSSHTMKLLPRILWMDIQCPGDRDCVMFPLKRIAFKEFLCDAHATSALWRPPAVLVLRPGEASSISDIPWSSRHSSTQRNLSVRRRGMRAVSLVPLAVQDNVHIQGIQVMKRNSQHRLMLLASCHRTFRTQDQILQNCHRRHYTTVLNGLSYDNLLQFYRVPPWIRVHEYVCVSTRAVREKNTLLYTNNTYKLSTFATYSQSELRHLYVWVIVCRLWAQSRSDTFHHLVIIVKALWSSPFLHGGEQVFIARQTTPSWNAAAMV